MSRATIRNLMIFLVINVILALAIIGNYLFRYFETEEHKKVQLVPPGVNMITINSSNKSELAKNEQTKTLAPATPAATPSVSNSTPVVATNSTESPAVSPTKAPEQSNPSKTANAVTTTINPTVTDNKAVCIIMGPFSAENKGMMDFILNRYKQTDLAKVEKKRIYQIFWNLGPDKESATKLFEKQKEGPMADPKFVLQQTQNKNWIVNIVKVNGSNAIADKLTADLAAKAKKINAGGSWEYRALPEGYFYTFPDFKKIEEGVINQIDTLLSPTKEPC